MHDVANSYTYIYICTYSYLSIDDNTDPTRLCSCIDTHIHVDTHIQKPTHQTSYVMMRLHHLLYERLQTARGICEQARDAKGASVAHPLKVSWCRIGGLLVAVIVVGCGRG